MGDNVNIVVEKIQNLQMEEDNISESIEVAYKALVDHFSEHVYSFITENSGKVEFTNDGMTHILAHFKNRISESNYITDYVLRLIFAKLVNEKKLVYYDWTYFIVNTDMNQKIIERDTIWNEICTAEKELKLL